MRKRDGSLRLEFVLRKRDITTQSAEPSDFGGVLEEMSRQREEFVVPCIAGEGVRDARLDGVSRVVPDG